MCDFVDRDDLLDGINQFKPVIGVTFREELMNEAETRAEPVAARKRRRLTG
jgi:hypothetical protein